MSRGGKYLEALWISIPTTTSSTQQSYKKKQSKIIQSNDDASLSSFTPSERSLLGLCNEPKTANMHLPITNTQKCERWLLNQKNVSEKGLFGNNEYTVSVGTPDIDNVKRVLTFSEPTGEAVPTDKEPDRFLNPGRTERRDESLVDTELRINTSENQLTKASEYDKNISLPSERATKFTNNIDPKWKLSEKRSTKASKIDNKIINLPKEHTKEVPIVNLPTSIDVDANVVVKQSTRKRNTADAVNETTGNAIPPFKRTKRNINEDEPEKETSRKLPPVVGDSDGEISTLQKRPQNVIKECSNVLQEKISSQNEGFTGHDGDSAGTPPPPKSKGILVNKDAETLSEDEIATGDINNKPSRHIRVVMENGGDGILPRFFQDETSGSESSLSVVSPSPLGTSGYAATAETPSTSSSTRKYKPRSNTRRRLKEKSERQKQKEAYNAGLPYKTSHGKPKEGRKLGPGCKENCNRCEKPRISEENRNTLLKEFWNLKTHLERWDYLSRRVKSFEPKRRKTLPERAKNSVKVFTFKIGQREVRVCKTMFLQTLDINHSWVDTALRKVNQKGNITPEKRGGHTNRPNRCTEEQKASARQHIDSVERIPSHYCRTSTKREYFEAGLNFERLYKMYLEWAKEKGVAAGAVATKSMYHEIFMTEYNTGFHKPLKDQCVTCAKWSNGNDDTRKEMEQAYLNHLEMKNLVKKLKAQEKGEGAADNKFCVACFDLEKVLTCPHSAISVMFYKTKLSIYNFTILELHSNLGHCFIWNETVASRGANEIASNLIKFLREKCSERKTRFSFYSDSPTGQKRNRIVFALWLYVAVKYNVSITHRFFESGHSFSEVDSMHGRIESEAKLKEIFNQDEWEKIILTSKQNDGSYMIKHLTQDSCFDFHKLVDKLVWKSDTDSNKVLWSNVRQIRVDYRTPAAIFYKYDFKGGEKSIIVNPSKNAFDLKAYEFEPAYDGPLPLPA